MSRPTLLFVHGWGFDARFWEPLQGALAGFPSAAADRGYFGTPADPACPGPVLAIGHSLGALLALRAPPPTCIGLVAINGFDRFCAGDDMAGVPPRVVDRMIARFAEGPAEVVAEFRRRCGTLEPFGGVEEDRLAADLALLRHADARGRSAGWDAPLLSLHGGADPILPPGLRESAFGACRHRRIEFLAEAGHLLPQSHPRWCAERVLDLLGPRA